MSVLGLSTCRRARSQKRWAVVTAIALLISPPGGFTFAPIVSAQAPAGAGFALNAGDLRFIFRQIQIAQAHSAGGALFGPGPNQVNEVRLPFGLRTVDGSFNHLDADKTRFGASDQLFPRMTDPVFQAAENGTSYAQLEGIVSDAQPRIISNLIADQTVRNPAAVAVADVGPAAPLGTLPIGNVATDAGLSAPFNSMFTFFGQFFDHGLDLVNKGGNGTVFVPLQPDDPLFDADGPDNIPNNGDETNFMVLTRATVNAEHEATNQTTPFVDQNQTYTSHPSHQAFLRAYTLGTENGVNNIPRPTGRMIDGAGGNIGNWNEVKASALANLGIILSDMDVHNVPLLFTDPYGHLIRNANGRPRAVLANGTLQALNPANPIASSLLARTNHEFLNDIAHQAAPAANLVADSDNIISVVTNTPTGRVVTPPQDPGTYDDELLGIHFVTGDGRGNENIALTAVHTVFHSEHNRLRANIDALIHTPGLLTAAEVVAWETTDPASGWTYGERLFQAARFVTEMQYQHLVFEEFARKVSPSINAFIGDGLNFVNNINPAIFAEFAHQTYRLGHSMLTETVARQTPTGVPYDIPLLDAFLNPAEFNRGLNGVPLTAAQAAGGIFQGGTAQLGMEIDEFVTEAVRNRLVGLPLDLAVLNIARGRSEGVAPLNEVRRQVFAITGDPALKPYTDWMDFFFNMRHSESFVNFIAAYGIHPTLQAATTVAAKRTAAAALENDAAFLFTPAAQSGVNRIDLWMGGLAERPNPFGGLLGSTFNLVFEVQLENLQNADRFYYLERLDGLNLLSQLEGNSFAELISRNTSLTGPPADVFSKPGIIFNLSQQNLTGPIIDDPLTPDYNEAQLLTRLPNGVIRYNGPEHVVFNGRNDANPDRVFSSEGDDTLRGNGGNDVMEGGSGNDQHIGGDGDDILTDTFGDDVMKGGPGNDAIFGGSGPFDLLQGNEGNDFVVGGNDESEVFGGPGNDIIYMGAGLSESVGGAGDDWMEGTVSPASIAIGDDNNQFQNDPNGGHDILLAGPGDLDFDAEGGDDIMVGNVIPTHRFEGMLGFDWVTYRGETRFVDADMLITGATAINAPLNEGRDRYDNTEGLSGTNFNDLLRGDDRTLADLTNDGLTGVVNGHVLNAAGIARITGLAALLPNNATSFGDGNIILGGPGSDILEGRGGDDILDGDAWLNVQLRVSPTRAVDSLQAIRNEVQAGTIAVSAITMERSIVTPNNQGAFIDTAVFSGARAEYVITVSNNGNRITVDHQGGIDGVDTLRRIERIQFSDVTLTVTGGVVGGTPVPNVAGQTLANATANITSAGLTVGTSTLQNSNTVQAGRVLQTDPIAGVMVVPGSPVNLFISLGPLIPDVHDHAVAGIPAPAGSPLAADELALSGLVVGTITMVSSIDVEPGLVVTQSPLPGGTILPGGAVNLFVSSGPPAPNTVPAVVGLDQGDADDAILTAGLTVGARTFQNSATVPAGAVISTTPVAGTVLAAGTAVASVVSLGTSGLVAEFGFNELTGGNTDDSSVVGATGAIRQALRVPGKFGNGLQFDGINDWVTVTDTTNSPLDLTTAMTMEAWVRPTSMSGWETVFMKERGAAGTGLLSYALYAHDGAPGGGGAVGPAGYARMNPTLTTTDQGIRRTPAVALPLNVWSHLAVTYDGAQMRLYVDGVQVASRALTGSMAVSNNPLRIGGNNVSGEFFNGQIDEVRIYNRALSAAEILADRDRPVQ
jgi:beta-lactam-binding protein with PASTA domain